MGGATQTRSPATPWLSPKARWWRTIQARRDRLVVAVFGCRESAVGYHAGASSPGPRVGRALRVEDDAVADAGIGALAGDRIYFGTVGGPVVFYVLEPDDWLTIASQAPGRNLTREEWEQYLGSLRTYRATCPDDPSGA